MISTHHSAISSIRRSVLAAAIVGVLLATGCASSPRETGERASVDSDGADVADTTAVATSAVETTDVATTGTATTSTATTSTPRR